MEKRLVCLLVLLSFVKTPASSQVAEWIIPPRYESLFPVFSESVILAENRDSNNNMWDLDGNALCTVKGKLCSFHQGYAALIDENTSYIKGLLSPTGAFTPIDEGIYRFGTAECLGVSSNQLLVWDTRDSKFYYIDKDGNKSVNYYIDAQPFLNGFASCLTYENQEKEKNLYCYLLRDDLTWVQFHVDKKEIDIKNVQFISSVNDEDVCVVVVSGKLYLYKTDLDTLVPVCAKLDETNLKLQAKVQDADAYSMMRRRKIIGKCGKEGFVRISLDNLKRPTEIQYVDGTIQTWEMIDEEEPAQKTSLSVLESENQFGLRWGSEIEALPAQFDSIPICFEDKAIVCVKGKYGMLKIHPESKFSLSVYKGDDTPIPFRHKTFETDIQLDIPSFLPAEKAVLDMSPDSGCRVDLRTADARNTPFGNSLRYKATLQIPSELKDDEFLEVKYPAKVRYEQLISPTIVCTARARHYKYYTILVNEDGLLDDQKGTYTFMFSIDKERNIADDDVFLTPRVYKDSVRLNIDKSSESLYRCVVDTLSEGINNILIEVWEDGCPPVKVAYEIMYTKPVAKTKSTPAKEGKATITKKEKTVIVEPPVEEKKRRGNIVDMSF